MKNNLMLSADIKILGIIIDAKDRASAKTKFTESKLVFS